MKMLTHKLVIYDDGWKFKWEEKDRLHSSALGVVDLFWIALLVVMLVDYLTWK